MKSTSSISANYKSYNRNKKSGSDWSRNSLGSKLGIRKNFESDKFTGKRDGKSGSGSSSIEKSALGQNKTKGSRNFESDKYSGRRDKKNATYSMLENSPFSQKRSKIFNYSHLLGANKIKNKSRSGHQEGLFSSRETRYQDTRSRYFKRKGKLNDKVGVKKLH